MLGETAIPGIDLTEIENCVRFSADTYASERAPDTAPGPFRMPEGGRMDLDCDLQHALWTTAEAAEAAGVTPDVIYQWKRRGKLTPVNRRGRPRYRAMDVLRTEQSTRGRAGRHHAAA